MKSRGNGIYIKCDFIGLHGTLGKVGLTQNEFSKLVGLMGRRPQGTIYGIEQGRTPRPALQPWSPISIDAHRRRKETGGGCRSRRQSLCDTPVQRCK